MCVCVGFGSNDLVTKTQSFSMNGHYRMNIINSVGYSRSDSVMSLVLCMVAVQYLGQRYCTTGPSGFGTLSSLLRMGNISIYYIHDKLSSHNVECAL